MANNGGVIVPPDSTGKTVDCSSLSVAGVTAYRQRIVIADSARSANFAVVSAGGLAINGTVGLNAGTNNIGAVSLAAGTAKIGRIANISATVNVAGTLTVGGQTGNASATVGSTYTLIGGMDGSLGRVALTDAAGHFVITGTVVLAAGANNIGTINNISAAVAVSGQVSLGPGTSNIGTINNISAAVVVSGAVSLAAGANNIGLINNISATVVVAGEIAAGSSLSTTNKPVLMGGNDNSTFPGTARALLLDANGRIILGAGANNIGTINNISAGVVLAAGAANIGSINNISANVNVVLQAGSNNIGTINNISAAVVLATQFSGNASATAASPMLLIGGTDGSLGRVALTDAAGHFVITGTVALAAGANNIGSINNISAAVVLAAGANNIGTINNISAAVVLGAGAANIGFINNISANVNVVLQTGTNNIGTIQAISAAVGLAAGANNIGSINNISAPVVVNGMVAFNTSVTAGNSPILMGGRVKTSASTTATAHSANHLWLDKAGRLVVINGNPALVPSASHGPKTVTVSTSASVVLIASGGAGTVAYVTGLTVTNGSATLTRADIYEVSATATPIVAQYLAASGGGFSMQFNPPWRVSAATVLNCRVKPNVSQCLFTVHFYVGVD